MEKKKKKKKAKKEGEEMTEEDKKLQEEAREQRSFFSACCCPRVGCKAKSSVRAVAAADVLVASWACRQAAEVASATAIVTFGERMVLAFLQLRRGSRALCGRPGATAETEQAAATQHTLSTSMPLLCPCR